MAGVLLYGHLSIASAQQAYDLSFWPGPNAEKDRRFLQFDDHPCGKIAVARVVSLPPPRKGQALEPERVVEISPKGAVVRRWPMPVDYSPVAIEGNRILVQYGQASQLWVDTQGNISSPSKPIPLEIPERASCPRLREFGNSAYAGCWTFHDRKAHKPRILAFEGVCT